MASNLPEGTITLHVRNMRNVFLFVGNSVLAPYGNTPVTFSTLDQVRYFVTLQQNGAVTTDDEIPADIIVLLNQTGQVVSTPIPVVMASLAGGIYTSTQTITLTPNSSTTTIYFTLDNSIPTTSSNIYMSPITINETTTLKFFGENADGTSSTVQQITYTIINQLGDVSEIGVVPQKDLVAAEEPFSGSANVTHTFAHPMDYFVIKNDDTIANLTFTIGSETVTVGPGQKFDDKFNPFTSVTVTTAVSFRAYGKRIVGTTTAEFVVADGLAGSTSGTKSFAGKARGVVLNNNGTADVTIALNGIAFTVKKGEDFDEEFDPFQSVTINATSSFEAYFKGISSEISPDLTPPANVTTNTPINITSASVRLSWNAVADADLSGYNVYSGPTKLNSTLLITTLFDISGLHSGQSYSFKITSVDKVGNESTGTIVNVTTSASVLPNDVTNLSVTSITSGSMILTWTASTTPNIEEYQIFQNGTKIGSVVGTTYSVIGLNPSTTYEFTVKAVDSTGLLALGLSVTATTTAASVVGLADVTNLSYANLTSTSVTLNWTASISSNVIAYDIYYQGAAIGTTPANTFDLANLLPNTTYAYTVFAKDSSGNASSGALINFTTPAS